MPPRQTIAREVLLEGAGLHEGRPARLRLRPAPAGSGIRFLRTDVPGATPVLVDVAHASGEGRRTQVGLEGGSVVQTIEHLMSAVHARGLTDLLCEIDDIEVPGMDGSARAFDEAIAGAGVQDLGVAAPILRLDRVVEVLGSGGSRIVASPAPGRLVVAYALDYSDVPGMDAPVRQRVEVVVTPETFARELAPARTFAFEQEALLLRSLGFGKGATTQNTLIIRPDGTPLENALRFKDEYARHKALDLLGDLMLLGVRLEARVSAYKAGHALNAELVRRLRAIYEERTTARASGAFTPAPAAFDGHFPGDPVLPGIVMLAAARGGADAIALEGAKFRRVVRPGETLAIERTPGPGGRVRARGLSAGEPVFDATWVLAPDERESA